MKYLYLLLILYTHLSYSQHTFLIRQVKLFDGQDIIEETDILVSGGVISKIGSSLIVDSLNVSVIDGQGMTVIPGLVNCHVHAWLPYHLQNAMQAGVFAVLDMHTSIPPNSLRRYKLADGFAQFYSAGYAATVEKGHGTQYGFEVPTLGEGRTARQFVNEAVSRGSDYIKIIYEPKAATLSIEQVASLVEASDSAGLVSIAHISTLADASAIIETGLSGFAHLWQDAPASNSLIDAVAGQGVFVIPTLSVLEGVIMLQEQQNGNHSNADLSTLQREVKRLHDAGVPILAGTDPPNVGLDYGSSLHNELRLYVAGGLTPLEALKSATSVPNNIFNLGDIGIIREGMVANFLVIAGNPLQQIEEISNIESIWAGGVKIK